MKKIVNLIIAISILATPAIAQTDASAKKILDAVSAKLKTYKGISANFSMTTKGRTGKINNNSTGKIAIKGNKYYIKQGTTEIFNDGNKTWNYNGNDEVTVTDGDVDGEALTPQRLLSDFYDKDFTYKLVSTGANFHEIQMTPVDKRKNFQRVNIFVDKTKMMVTKARVLDKSNNTTEFNLSNIITNAGIADNTFVFDAKKYKKRIEVIE